MAKRKIIEIDRDKCDGCGLCTDACAEGALGLDEENKAVLLKEIYCDGLGACLDVCPTDALKIIERESDDYDPQKTYSHVLETQGSKAALQVHGASPGCETTMSEQKHFPSGCPGSMSRSINRDNDFSQQATGSAASELSQWPIQLHLVSPFAPYFKNSDLLIAADCTAFSLGSFHQDLLKGKKLIIACPKLDDTSNYVQKLAEIIKQNNLRSLTIAIMSVPCCSGLRLMVEEAVSVSGINLTIKTIVVGIDGNVQSAASL